MGCNVQHVCMRTNCKLLCSSAAQAGPHTAVALGILAFESYNSPQGALRPAKEYAKVKEPYDVLAACLMQTAAFTFSLGKEPFNIMLWDALRTHLLCEGLVRDGAAMKACHLALCPQQLLLGIGHHISRPLQRCWVACALQPLLLTKDILTSAFCRTQQQLSIQGVAKSCRTELLSPGHAVGKSTELLFTFNTKQPLLATLLVVNL